MEPPYRTGHAGGSARGNGRSPRPQRGEIAPVRDPPIEHHPPETEARARYAARVRYAEHAPTASLREHVDCFWTILAEAGAPGYRVLPDGAVDLIFEPSSGVRVIGAMTRALVTGATAGSLELLGVRFRPGEAASFLCVSMRELRDAAAPLEDLWGAEARGLGGAMGDARGPGARIAVLERALLARLAARPRGAPLDAGRDRVRTAVAAMAGPAPPRIDALASRLGVTERTLERAFDERVGLGPKSLSRVMRLQRLVASIDDAGRSWSAAAVELGFADQPHLIRDVTELAGTSPTALLRERRAMSDSFNPGELIGATVPPSPASGAIKERRR